MNTLLSQLQILDIELLNYARGLFDLSNPIISLLIKHGSDILLLVLPVWMILLWLISSYYRTIESKEYALKIFYSATLGVIFCLLLNLLLPFRPRPETVSAIAPLIDHLPDNSFPSMHATFAGATLSALFLFYFPFLSASLGKFGFLHARFVRYIFVILGIIMVISRVLAGIHYPGDILAGILLGALSAFIISKLVMKKWFYIPTIQYPIKLLSYIKL